MAATPTWTGRFPEAVAVGMRIRQWKISRILYAGFGLLVLVYLLSSIGNAPMMRSMQGGLVQIEQENNVQIGLANDMLKAISGVNLSVRKVMMLVADDEIAAEVKVYQEGMADYRRVRERLATAVTAHADNPVWKPVEACGRRLRPRGAIARPALPGGSGPPGHRGHEGAG